MMMMLKFVEHNSNSNLRGKRLTKFAMAWPKKPQISKSHLQKTFDDRNSWTLVWWWFLGNFRSLVFLSFAIPLKKFLKKLQSIQQASPSIKYYFVVYATLLDEEVSYSSRWRVLQYSIFFPNIFLSDNRQWQICNLMTAILLDEYFFSFLTEFFSFKLISSSEKKISNGIFGKGWIIYCLLRHQEVSLSWHFA